MNIRRACMADLEKILQIYEHARQQMKSNGNPTQWGDTRPTKESIVGDINSRNGYVIEINGNICGVFAFIIGEDPTYHKIDGSWLNQEAYGTVHRIASNGTVKGIFEKCLEFCASQIPNIRIDTHENNKIMQHLLEKYHFERCGIIYLADGSPRIAYQRKSCSDSR